jgi:hypothetical protein
MGSFLEDLINREVSSGQTEPRTRTGEEVKNMAKSMVRERRVLSSPDIVNASFPLEGFPERVKQVTKGGLKCSVDREEEQYVFA